MLRIDVLVKWHRVLLSLKKQNKKCHQHIVNSIKSLNPSSSLTWKCHYDQIFDFQFFTLSWTIRLSYSPCQILIYYKHQKSFHYNIYSREFTAAINQPCSTAWLRIGKKWRQRLKNTSQVEIRITISKENCTKNKSKVFVAFRVIFNTYRYYNFNPWGILAFDVIFSQSATKPWNKVV